MSEGQQPEGVAVPLVWVGVEDLPILFANSFVCQFDVDLESFILTIGQVAPPALIGTPEAIAEQAQEIEFVAVKPLARLALSRTRMDELATVLQANVEQRDRAATMRPGDPR